jgi:hypothetical protein
MGQLKTIGLLAVSIAFAAIGVAMALTGEGPDRAIGLAVAAFFGGCGVVFALEPLPKEALRPDAQGVTLIRPSRTRLAGLSAAAALMAVACPQIAAMAGADGDVRAMWIGLFGALFFGLGALIGFLRLMRPKALYRLDHVGIANLQGREWFIPWRAIRGIDAYAVRGQYFLALDVDPALEARTGLMQKVNALAGFPGVSVGTQGTAVRFDEFAELVKQYWDRGRLMQTHN